MKPIPTPTALTQPYWDAVQRKELVIQRCQDCRHWIHTPQLRCTQCHSQQLLFEKVSGLGIIETFSVVYKSFSPGFKDETPYVIAWVELDEQPGLRLFCNVTGFSDNELVINSPVEVTFEYREGFGLLPQFKKPS